jgi:hypothetical protein
LNADTNAHRSALMCIHLQARREPWIAYVEWYVGRGVDTDLLCIPCADLRAAGQEVRVIGVCEECYEFATYEVGNLSGIRGTPQIIVRPEPFDHVLVETPLPNSVEPSSTSRLSNPKDDRSG